MIYQADMNTFLTELNGYSWFHEDSVFIAGELAEPGSAATPSTSEQNDAIRRFTTENTQARLARTASVSTQVDNIHFDGPGAVEAGRLYADAMFAPSTELTTTLVDKYSDVAAIATPRFYFDSRYGVDDVTDIGSWEDRTGNYTATNSVGVPFIDSTTGALVLDDVDGGEGNFTFTPSESSGAKTLIALVQIPDQQQNHGRGGSSDSGIGLHR